MKALFQFIGRITVEGESAIGLFTLTCLVAGAGIGIYVVWYARTWLSAKKWICVDGRIVELQEIKNRYGSGLPRINVRYEYIIDGVKYTGTRYQFGCHRDRPIHSDLIQTLVRARDRDETIKVFVDRKRQTRSTLDVGFDTGGIALLAGIALLTFVPILIYMIEN